MNVRHPIGAVHSFSIKKIFYEKMNLRLFYFRVTICNHNSCWYINKGNVSKIHLFDADIHTLESDMFVLVNNYV